MGSVVIFGPIFSLLHKSKSRCKTHLVSEIVPYVKTPKLIKSLRPYLLTIKVKTSFSKTLSKITSSKRKDFVWVRQTKIEQMMAVLLVRLLGKKFFWIQNFTNPPSPNFFTRLLLTQADRIIVGSRKIANKLILLGIDKSKIKVQRRS